MNLKKVLTTLIIGLAIFAGGFATGLYYQKNHSTSAARGSFEGKTPPNMSADGSSNMPSGMRNGGPGGNMTSGEIISINDDSMTIKTSDGSTKNIYFSDSTTVTKNETGSISDLTVGTNISVNGTTNSDNSITSKTIMITPQMAQQQD